MTDMLRWIAITEGTIVIGSLIAMYERVGRFVLPTRTMRVIFASSALLVQLAIFDVYGNLGEHFQWTAPFAASTFTLYLAGLASLWWYYRGPDGRLQRHDLAERFAMVRIEEYLRLSKAVRETEGHAARALPSLWQRLFGVKATRPGDAPSSAQEDDDVAGTQ